MADRHSFSLVLVLVVTLAGCSPGRPSSPGPTPSTTPGSTVAPLPSAEVPGTAVGCRFALGIAELAEALGPDLVGGCLEDEHADPATGVVTQQTGNGLFVWDGAVVAFTDGLTTWRACPDGIDRRPALAPFNGCGRPETTPTPIPAGVPDAAPPMSAYDCPGSHPIKAGPTPREGELLYYLPRSASYDLARPAECFATEADARAAGYRRGPH